LAWTLVTRLSHRIVGPLMEWFGRAFCPTGAASVKRSIATERVPIASGIGNFGAGFAPAAASASLRFEFPSGTPRPRGAQLQ
jgi:hypothetical protein